jgi:hypothetical protein
LIVVGFIAFNFLRGFISGVSPASETPTTAPAQTAHAILSTPLFTIDPNLNPGTVRFGEAQGTSCDVTYPGTSFSLGTRVWWSATLGIGLPGNAKVVWQLGRGGSILGSGTGPGDSPGGVWDVLCGNEPIVADASGTYVLKVLDSTQRVVLSVGQFTVAGAPSLGPSTKP